MALIKSEARSDKVKLTRDTHAHVKLGEAVSSCVRAGAALGVPMTYVASAECEAPWKAAHVAEKDEVARIQRKVSPTLNPAP